MVLANQSKITYRLCRTVACSTRYGKTVFSEWAAMNYRGSKGFAHGKTPLAAVLLVNLGTPEAPTASAVRRYLAEFLADPRVIELPRWLWWLILHGVILRLRPRRSAQAYQRIWSTSGSPLLTHTRELTVALQDALKDAPGQVEVHLAMRYGEPSIATVLRQLQSRNLRRLLVLPLYPQYSGTTTGSVFDAVAKELGGWRWLPELGFISDYFQCPGYAEALAGRIAAHHAQNGHDGHLLFSFHGIPERYVLSGDPYYCHCLATARRVAELLQLGDAAYSVSFQSRVGRERWLHPYTDHELARLAAAGIKNVDVICPAFAVDCLETLEEIAIGERERFLQLGGSRLSYIPALNAEPDHTRVLAALIRQRSQHWPEWHADATQQGVVEQAQSCERHRVASPEFGRDKQ